MKRTNFFLTVATLGPIGYFPAPGTVATFATIPLLYLISLEILSHSVVLGCLSIFSVVSLYVVKQALVALDRADDPSEIVLDELVGCLVAFLGISFNVPLLILGIVLFRFFDITKIGIRSCELLFGAWGIMADDIAAGILTNIILRVVGYWLL